MIILKIPMATNFQLHLIEMISLKESNDIIKIKEKKDRKEKKESKKINKKKRKY